MPNAAAHNVERRSSIGHEKSRLEALDRLAILDGPPDRGFDRIVKLLQNVYDVPIALIALLDAHRHWAMACTGLDEREHARRDALCNYTIQSDCPLIVENTLEDPRFVDNAFVRPADGLRFYAGVPLVTTDGYNIGTVCIADTRPRKFAGADVTILSDIGAITMDAIELRGLASTDALTGALSRRAINEESQRALARARRFDEDVSLIAIDLDHFKRINDNFGHAAGDLVLKAAVNALTATLRKSDRIGRTGGEEFVVLAPHTDAVGARRLAERMRRALQDLVVDFGHQTLRATASFGIASADMSTPDFDALLANADAALYDAKAAGRNCIVVWQVEQTTPPAGTRRVLKAGSICLPAGHGVIDCTVRRLSDQAASLDVISPLGIPDMFKLAIPADGFESRCRVTRRSATRIEVAFV